MPDRHSILLIVHRDPRQVRRLVERLRHPDVDLWMHVDAKVDIEPFRAQGVRQLARRVPVSWSGFGCVRTTLAWLREAMEGTEAARFTILTGQDYPLRPVGEIVERLREGSGDRVDFTDGGEDRRWRYERLWIYPGEHRPARRLLLRAARKLWYRDRSCRSLPAGLAFASGSAYWTLGRESVAWMLDFLARRPDVERFFEHTFAPDEMFFHTLLRSSPRLATIEPAVHHIDWSGGGAHPKWLGMEDLPSMKAGGGLFARKFKADDPVLDALDRDDATPARGP